MNEETRKKLYNDLSALRDEVFWYEDANNLTDTPEKKILDRALDALLDLTLKAEAARERE